MQKNQTDSRVCSCTQHGDLMAQLDQLMGRTAGHVAPQPLISTPPSRSALLAERTLSCGGECHLKMVGRTVLSNEMETKPAGGGRCTDPQGQTEPLEASFQASDEHTSAGNARKTLWFMLHGYMNAIKVWRSS